MSWFGGKVSVKEEEKQNGLSKEELQAFKTNQDTNIALFSSALEICYLKCIDKELNMTETSRGEARCIDKCIGKFFKMMPKVNVIFTEHQQKKAAQFGQQ